MFAIFMFILMIYLFYFGFNIYYDLFHRQKLAKDPNYFVQYEMEKPKKNQREEVPQNDFAGILKPNSPRLSKSSTASLSNPRTSSPSSLQGKTNSSRAQAQNLAPTQNLPPKKLGRFARWRVEARKKNAENDLTMDGNNSFLIEEPAVAVLDEFARKERLEAVTRRVFENINRSGSSASKKIGEPKSNEDSESFLKPLVFGRVEKKVNDKVNRKMQKEYRETDRENIVDPKTESSGGSPKKTSIQANSSASSNKRVSVSEQHHTMHENPSGNTKKTIVKHALKELEEINETKEVQDSKAKWRQLMNLAETSIVVERVDGIKVYKSTLFDSDSEVES